MLIVFVDGFMEKLTEEKQTTCYSRDKMGYFLCEKV